MAEKLGPADPVIKSAIDLAHGWADFLNRLRVEYDIDTFDDMVETYIEIKDLAEQIKSKAV